MRRYHEVHERSVESDLLLLLLRRLLLTRTDLRIVLMSATADADLFADYFSLPGRGGVEKQHLCQPVRTARPHEHSPCRVVTAAGTR